MHIKRLFRRYFDLFYKNMATCRNIRNLEIRKFDVFSAKIWYIFITVVVSNFVKTNRWVGKVVIKKKINNKNAKFDCPFR